MAEQNQEKSNVKYLVRVANTDLNGHKPIKMALTKIKGIGQMFSNFVCVAAGVNRDTKAGVLSDAQVSKITDVINHPANYSCPTWLLNRRKDFETGEDKHIISGDLLFTKENDLKRLKKSKSYRGLRHHWGLPLRGQRTKSNFRKSKAKGKGGLGVKRKKK